MTLKSNYGYLRLANPSRTGTPSSLHCKRRGAVEAAAALRQGTHLVKANEKKDHQSHP